MSADCPAGATSAKVYKDHVDSGAAYIVDGKITKTFSNIEVGVSHLYGLSALHSDVESAITEEEYTAPAMYIDPFIFGSTNITGTYSGDVEKGKLYVNDTYAGVIGGSFKGGKFTFYARGKFLATDKVELEGLDSQDAVIVEKQRIDIISILTVETYIPGTSSWISGTYEGTIVKRVGLYVNEENIGNVPIDVNTPGQFEYWKDDLKETDVVQVYLATKEGKELTKADVPISTEEHVPTSKNTTVEIKTYLDTQNISYPSNAKKAELLSLIK